MTTTQLLTVFEVAERLRVGPYYVRELLRDKALYGFKVGDEWRVPEEAIDDYLAARANNASSVSAPPLRRKIRGRRRAP